MTNRSHKSLYTKSVICRPNTASTGDIVHLSHSFSGFLVGVFATVNVTRKFLQLHCFS